MGVPFAGLSEGMAAGFCVSSRVVDAGFDLGAAEGLCLAFFRFRALPILLPHLFVDIFFFGGRVHALFLAVVGREVLILDKFPDRNEGVRTIRMGTI